MKLILYLLLATFASFALVSCGGDDQNQETGDVTDGSLDVACEDLSPEECAKNDECFGLLAEPIDPMNRCFLPPVDNMVCLGSQTVCDDEETFAIAPDGQCWFFGNSCLPPGFVNRDDAEENISEVCVDFRTQPACE